MEANSRKAFWVADVILKSILQMPAHWRQHRDNARTLTIVSGRRELLRLAKGAVSAKSYDFDTNVEQPLIDYRRLLHMLRTQASREYVGIEYEGFTRAERRWHPNTKALLERYL